MQDKPKLSFSVKKMKNFLTIALSLTLFSSLSHADQDCYGYQRKNNTGAKIIGAIAGGLLGSTVGKGDGRRAAIVGGAILGGVVGNETSKDYSCEERRYSDSTFDEAVYDNDIGRPHYWNGDRRHGYVVITNDGYYNNTYCRQFENVVIVNDGYREYQQINRGYVCQGRNGQWYQENRSIRFDQPRRGRNNYYRR